MKLKFKLICLLIGLVIILIIWYNIFINKDKEEATMQITKMTTKVIYWDLSEDIEVVGSAELVDEQSLGFNIAWTITKVNVKAWDYVNKWDIIAEIDNTDAMNNIKDAQISLDNARLSLTQLYELPDESKIQQSKNSISQAQNTLDTAKKELENLKVSQENTKQKQLDDIENLKKELESSKKSLSIALIELENLKKEKNQSLDNTISNKNTTIKTTEDSFKTYINEIDKIITETDYILWVTEKNSKMNDSYEIYLWAKNSSLKSEANIALSKSISLFDDLKILVNNYDYSWNKERMISILGEVSSMYESIYDLTDLLYLVGENSVESDSFSKSQIDSIKTSASSYRSTALTKISNIKTTINTINTLTDIELVSNSNEIAIVSKEEQIKSQELSIQKQELNISNAEKTYNELLASQKVALISKENDVDSKEKALELAKLSDSELYKWPTEENLKKAQNSITSAELRVENARKSLEDYQLIAPFDWIVRKVDYMVWDNLKNDTDKYVYLENPDAIEITVKLDQIDIVNVKVGNKAIITFDAYSTTPVNAKVSLIDTTPVSTSWVVTYEVKLIIDDEIFNKTILSWMTANVEIITSQKENILILNSQAIFKKGDKSYVKKSTSWIIEEVEVEVGMTANNLTEIISPLEEWDIIIYDSISINSRNNSTTTTTWFWWMWWVGGSVRVSTWPWMMRP